MEIFRLTLNQMMVMFLLVLTGFLLRKSKVLPSGSDITMSRLETYVFLPALNFLNQMKNCTVKTFAENSILILYGAVIIVIAVALSYPLSALFVRNSSTDELAYKRNIYKYAVAFGNYGFVGNFIILGIWGSEGLFKYSMFTLVIALFCSSWGLYILIPKDKERSIIKNLRRGITAPPIVALALGVICGFLGVKEKLPQFVVEAVSNASGCMGPVAMLLAGFVIGGYEFKSLFADKKVYAAALLRLIVLPAIIVLSLKGIGTNKEIMTLALIAFATPLGLNTIVYPASYGGDTKTGASMAMISQTLSVVTLPLMYLLLIVK